MRAAEEEVEEEQVWSRGGSRAKEGSSRVDGEGHELS